MNAAHRDALSNIFHVVSSLDHCVIRHLHQKLVKKLNVTGECRTGETLRDVCRRLLQQHIDNDEVSAILASATFTNATLQTFEHQGFLAQPESESTKASKDKLAAIMTDYHRTGNYDFEDNPLIEACKQFHKKVKEEICMPQSSCTNCHALDVGLVVTEGKCNLCAAPVRARNFSALNNMDPGDQPSQLASLTPAEIAAVSLILPVMTVYRMGDSVRMKGHSISFPQEIQETVDRLPRLPSNLSLVHISSPSPRSTHVFKVRKQRILEALLWLKEHNPHYARINIDHAALDQYPEDDVIDVPSYTLPEAANVTPDEGPADTDDNEHTFADTMRLNDTRARMPETDMIVEHIRTALQPPDQGTTAEDPLPWPEQGPPTGERAPGFWSKAFPHLFCHGQAGYNDPHPYTVSREEWARHLLRHKSGRFAADPRFVFFLFAYLQKEKAWTLGNLYAASNAFTTKAELMRQLSGSADELNNLTRKIVKSSNRIPGTNQYMKKIGMYAYSFVNHYRHHTDDTDNFNVFYTVSSADFHWPDFYAMFTEGRAHLAKTLVKSEEEIPAGADRQAYVTSSEDHLWRRNFLVKRAHHYDLYFRAKILLLIKTVLVPVFGVKDYIVRYEYQSRGAIHAHILLCIPMGISETERKRLWSIEKTADFEALREDLQAAVFQAGDEIPPHYPDDLSANHCAIYTEMRILIEFALRLGVTECHPSNQSVDWFVADAGLLQNAPPSAVLRQDFASMLEAPRTNLVDIVNKVGIHRCSRTYCCKPKTVTVRNENGEEEERTIATDCRFGYPRKLCGFEHAFDSGDWDEWVTGAERSALPVAPGNARHHNEYPVIRLLRNHRNSISYNPALMLAMPCNQDLQYICLLQHLINYIIKYIAKPEENSAAAANFQEEVFAAMDDDDPVRKYFQKVLQHATKEHDYTLPEVHLYLNGADAIQFSREMVILPALNDKRVDLSVGDADLVLTRTLGEIYDDRHTDQQYLALIEAYEQARDGGYTLPCVKPPAMISLYDFVSMFTKTWSPLPTFKVVHVLPSFKTRPSATTSPEWYRKFLLTMLRLHLVPEVPSLDSLDLLDNEDLLRMGDEFFAREEAPTWARELWVGDAKATTNTDVLPLIAPDLDVQPDQENAFVGQELLEDQDDLVAAGPAELIDADGQDIEHDDRYDNQHASTDFDLFADRRELCPDWTRETPHQFRTSIADIDNQLAASEEEEETEALPHNRLNPEQARAVELINAKMERLLDRGEPFYLEICGSAGTGKTTILRRCKQDLAEKLAASTDKSVGTMLRFAAATGAAAKVLPTPNCTLHKLVNLPIAQAKNKALEDLTAGALRTLQDSLKGVQVLIIDEKSFVGCRMMYDINARLQQIKLNTAPFGGLSVILLGDFKQLSPVHDLPLYTPPTTKMSSYQRIGLTEVYQANFKDVVVLKQNQRQESDELFKTIMTNFLSGDQGITHADWAVLHSRRLDQLPPEEQAQFDRDAVYLCAYKKHYRGRNIQKILDLNNPRKIVEAVNKPEGGARFDSNKAGGLPQQILLTRGMKVMLTANLDLSNGLSNGSTGTVLGIVYFTENDPFPTVLVQFDGYTGPSCLPMHDCAYPVGPIERAWTERKTVYQRQMLPLVPAYGISIHKSQGQTLGRVVINLGPKDFAPGLTYTALTRARGLHAMAFDPMPDMDRFNKVVRSKGFRAQLADDAKKDAMCKELLERLTAQQ